METRVVSMERATFDQWQSIGLVEGLTCDQEIAAFLIHMYDTNKEQGTPSFLCCRCHAPLTSLCDACRFTHPPPHPPPQQPMHLPSHPPPSLPHSLLAHGWPLTESSQPPGSDQSQTRSSLSCKLSQSQTRSSLSCKLSQSQTKTNMCYQSDQSQTGTELSYESDQSHARTNLSHIPNQSQSVSSPSCEKSQSQTGTAATAAAQLVTDQSEAHSKLCKIGNNQWESGGKPTTLWNSLLEVSANLSEPTDADPGPSQQKESGLGGVCVKEETDDDDDDDDDDDGVVCEEPEASPQVEVSLMKREDGETASASETALQVPATTHPSTQEGGRRRWGAMETKALTWFLDRYDVHAPSTWNHCALLLNAALHTSTTGEEWRQIALEKKLLSPRTKGHNQNRGATSNVQLLRKQSGGTTLTMVPPRGRRKTKGIGTTTSAIMELREPRRTRASMKRSRGLSSNQEEPQDASCTASNAQQVDKGRILRRPKRPGLRSSVPALTKSEADPDEGWETTHTAIPDVGEEGGRGVTPAHPPAQEEEDGGSPVGNTGQETLPSEEEEEEKPASSLQESEEGSDSTDAAHKESSCSRAVSDTTDAAHKESSCSRAVSDATDAHSQSSNSRLSWHYLGVADVDLPDITQKRKSFKRSPNDRYQCKECSSSFTHRGILVKHIRLAHLKWRPHRCHLCSAAYATKTKLERHVNVAHTKLRPFCCETCGASFVDHYTLLGHKETHNRDREYRFFCELCGKGYYGMRELKRHMETHSTRATKSLLCWVCGKAVRTTQYLRIHMRTHSPEKAFKCVECGHVFTSKCALLKHQASRACHRRLRKTKGAAADQQNEESRKKRVVSLIRKRRERKVGGFPCDICHKYFSAKKNIYKHKRSVHGIEARRESDDRILVTDPSEIARYLTPKNKDATALKFSCDICSKRYSSQESMRKHKNIVHLGRRDYKCDLCNKTFTRHTSVIEHKHNVHNPAGKSARPTVQCEICQKRFAAKNSLRKHVKTVHFGLLPYMCGDCGKKFASRYHLREHLKTSGHNPPPPPPDTGEREGASSGVDITTTTTTTTSSPTPHPHIPQTADVTSGTPAPLASLSTLPPWTPAPLPPSAGAVTPHQQLGVGVNPGEVRADGGSVTIRSLQSFHLWNMG